jgi:hypothetical protein
MIGCNLVIVFKDIGCDNTRTILDVKSKLIFLSQFKEFNNQIFKVKEKKQNLKNSNSMLWLRNLTHSCEPVGQSP